MKFIYFVCALKFLYVKAEDNDTFPENFLFGFSTASYQIEGAWNTDGKGENVWDKFVHTYPNKIRDHSNGDVACDSYHKYEEDVQILKNIGSNVYRFSLSWSRILPSGDVSHINRLGVQYYNNVINRLLDNGIQPMVTLFHWDLPQPLQNLGGWPNPILSDYFEDYARLAFQLFGDRVKWWITFNEPLETCYGSYGSYTGAPALGMSGIADYLCGHTILQSHARAYHLYTNEFKKVQEGKVGISLDGGWNEPSMNDEKHKKAAEDALEFQLGWFLHPILGSGGDYPKVMRKKIDFNSNEEGRRRSRLPVFSEKWKNFIKNTVDFLGINHYTTFLAAPAKHSYKRPSYEYDLNVLLFQNRSWPGSAAPWLRVEPTGFRKKLNWLKNYTNNFPVFVTENGYADKGNLKDTMRIKYYRAYLKELLKAIYKDGCNVIGFIAWSIIDNFEWLLGYTARFGIYNVDFNSPNRTRTPKDSSKFFKQLISNKKIPSYNFYA